MAIAVKGSTIVAISRTRGLESGRVPLRQVPESATDCNLLYSSPRKIKSQYRRCRADGNQIESRYPSSLPSGRQW